MTGWRHRARAATVLGLLALPAIAIAADWPTWGVNGSRNMVSAETGVVDSFDPGRFKGNTEDVDMATTRNVRWVAKLGSQTYGNPVVAGGRVYVGTNNESPRDPRIKDDYGILMCLEEKTGKLLWQLACPKLGTGKVSDWEFLGICSSPTVEGNRLWLVTNRCEVMCLDVEGMANGNDGPFKDEAKYLPGPNKPAIPTTPQDADIIWKVDMREELGVFPHNITTCSPLVFGNKVVVTTSNGVDWTHTNIPNPKAPALAMFDKNTGELLGEEASGVSARTLHSNWSTPTHGTVNGRDLIIFGGGDGICYGLSTETSRNAEGSDVLKEAWRVDCNPASYRFRDGKPLKYATYDGPSEIISTPVFHNNKVYVAIGQDPEHGEGVGRFLCLDPTKSGDATKTAVIWDYTKIKRAISTPVIAGGLVVIPDFSGFIHCLDAETGAPYWVYDTKSHIWGSPMVADGKVYIGTEDGDFIVLALAKQMKEIAKVDMRSPVYSSAVVANGVLYVGTPTHLYAIAK